MIQFINYYKCPYCGDHWEDVSECITFVPCPSCDYPTIPIKIEEIEENE